MLVSSFACSYETADIEFELLLSQAMQKGNNLAHHLIQSFAPGETTPEQAHEIGRQLADEVLQGKYPYVLTTHIDKGHVHNHIIFCAVNMVNQRKYVSNRPLSCGSLAAGILSKACLKSWRPYFRRMRKNAGRISAGWCLL